MAARKSKRPRCYTLHALAPDGTTMRTANDAINALVADRSVPMTLFHDHFLDRPGGVAVFYVSGPDELDAIEARTAHHLPGWDYQTHPLIFSFSPSAFDEQIAYTLRAYQGQDWDEVRRIRRPSYGNPSREAVTGIEE